MTTSASEAPSPSAYPGTGVIGLFPGQGSQAVGMGRRLAQRSAVAADVYERCGAATGVDIRRLCWESAPAALRRTENAQLALTVTCLAMALHFMADPRAPEVSAFAGHSVGALAAAAAAGWLSPEAAARLALERGTLMASAPGDGAMLAVAVRRADSDEQLEATAAELAASHDLDVAAFNGPTQIVLSGPRDAVKDAASALGNRARQLDVSHGFHSRLMRPVQETWIRIVDGVAFADGGRAYVRCTDGAAAYCEEAVRADLRDGLTLPVRWTAVMATATRYDSWLLFGPATTIERLARRYVERRRVRVVA